MKTEEQIRIRLGELRQRQNKSKSVTLNGIIDGQIDILEWLFE